MEKKRIEKDPITKIQKNQDEKRKQTENLRKERYEQRLKEDAKPKIKRPRERSQRSQNNNESSNNSQDEADNRISMRRTDNRPSRNKSIKKDFEIVMLGKVIIDRDRNIIKNVGKWHMEPVDKHGSDEFSFQQSKQAMDVEELSIEHFSGKQAGQFEHEHIKVVDDIMFTFADKN